MSPTTVIIGLLVLAGVVLIAYFMWPGSKCGSEGPVGAGDCPPGWNWDEKKKRCFRDGHNCSPADLSPQGGCMDSVAKLKEWLYECGVPWPKFGITADMIAPPGWKINYDTAPQKYQILPESGGHDCSPADVSNMDAAGRRRWAEGCAIPWPAVGATEERLCPPNWRPNQQSRCELSGNPSSPASFTKYSDANKSAWAKSTGVPWPAFGVPVESLCPDNWNYNPVTKQCIKEGHHKSPLAAWTWSEGEQQGDWARKQIVPWKHFNVKAEDLCPAGWNAGDKGAVCVDPDPTCSEYNDACHSPMRPDATPNKAAWATKSGVPWPAVGVALEDLCPDGWVMKKPRNICEKPGAQCSPGDLKDYDKQGKANWAKNCKAKWSKLGVS